MGASTLTRAWASLVADTYSLGRHPSTSYLGTSSWRCMAGDRPRTAPKRMVKLVHAKSNQSTTLHPCPTYSTMKTLQCRKPNLLVVRICVDQAVLRGVVCLLNRRVASCVNWIRCSCVLFHCLGGALNAPLPNMYVVASSSFIVDRASWACGLLG